MKAKSKWRGAVLLTMALVLAFSLVAITDVKDGSNEAEALGPTDLIWSLAEGNPAIGLPIGAGALLDVEVVPGTSTVYVLCDGGFYVPGVFSSVIVYRSDNGGLTWGLPVNLGPVAIGGINALVGTAGAEIGVDLEISPAYNQDGTLMVLTHDFGVDLTPATGDDTGFVYLSDDKGVTFGVAGHTTGAVPAGVEPTCLAVDPYFNSLLSGGTITVGGTYDPVTAASVWYETWQSPVVGWSGAWTAVLSTAPDTPDTLDLRYAPTSALRLIVVQNEMVDSSGDGFISIWGLTGSLATGFQALGSGLPGTIVGFPNDGSAIVWNDPIAGAAPNVGTTAKIGIGIDYDPVSSAACPNCPMYFYVATDDQAPPAVPPTPSTGLLGTLSWFDPTTGAFADLKATSTIPALHMDTSDLVVSGSYTRATVLTGCANVPLTYTVDVRTSVWSTPVYIEGDGGPIGLGSNNVGVKLAYGGSGNMVHAITAQVQATAYLAWLAPVPGDLGCLSQSDNFGASWWDTCLTQEPFINQVIDMVWPDTGLGYQQGFIVTNSWNAALYPFNIQSTFMSPAPTQWKRVDRWQGVQRITVSADGAAVLLLDTGTTGGKVLVSTDGGNTFTATPTDPTAIVTIMMTAFAAGTADDIFVGDWNGHIYVTHDGGTTWTDTGQVAGRVKSLAVPLFYATAKHVVAGVDSLSAANQDVIISKDDGASWSAPGVATWGPGGVAAAGNIKVLFSPSYTGVEGADNLIYAGLLGTMAGDNMYRLDASQPAATNLWANMWINYGSALYGGGVGAITPVSNFDFIRKTDTCAVETHTNAMCKSNVLYVTQNASNRIYVTYYPELCSQTNGLWRPDTAGLGVGAPVLWNANVALGGVALWTARDATPGGTLLPCPFDVALSEITVELMGMAYTHSWAHLYARDISVSLAAMGVAWDVVCDIEEGITFSVEPLGIPFLWAILTVHPLDMSNLMYPIDGEIVPSNNTATGEPVELQWPAVCGATAYDVEVLTDINIPNSVVVFAANLAATELSIGVGTLVDGQTYYWRARVARTTARDDETGPWSPWISFSIEAVEIHKAADLLSPASGETDVPVSPLFRWSVIQDVVTTEFQLATDAAFTDILLDLTGTEALGTQQTLAYADTLDYDTAYHWRVRGSGGSGIDAWTTPWAEGIFYTTAPGATPTPTPEVWKVENVDDDTPGWVWALIVIGGVLAVVVIVLIVRTRRPV